MIARRHQKGDAASEAIYDGARFAGRGVVLVSINYRLGALGWLAHPGFQATGEGFGGNFGSAQVWKDIPDLAHIGYPIAEVHEDGTAFIHKLAHVEDSLKASPGTLLSAALFRHVIEVDGVKRVDFGTGNDGYNQTLSGQRADAVRTALMRQGIDSTRVSARGYGETSPVSSNATAAGRQMNRRVEIFMAEAAPAPASTAGPAPVNTVAPAR